ncbi:DNA polymerase III subunit chi [Beggiatoa leptomitoformis]|uniref:DNA polymerase III subunit chi n=1 Tax=Beggiatoa leptomitoformis TaxID=288004 RepID=UPI000706816B|nr:DNA polymerase III subunit chi [Beggiatoa leptomitoformis]
MTVLNSSSELPTSPTQVDFYIFHAHYVQALERFVCRLIEKAYQQKHQIFVLANTEAQAKLLDSLLWVVNPDSFIPHSLLLAGQEETFCLNGEGKSQHFPVVIGYGTMPQSTRTLLINLAETVPDFFAQFQRIAELVAPEESARIAGRQRFRFYREQQVVLNSHDISK